MRDTVSFQILALYRSFLAYTTAELRALGLHFGQMPFLLYIGKHPGCTQAELTRTLELDWGYSQRGIAKLTAAGLIRKERDPERSCNHLTLTQQGRQAFDAVHQVFPLWDRQQTRGLSDGERDTLLRLLRKIAEPCEESGL